MGFAIPSLSHREVLWQLSNYFHRQPPDVTVRLVGMVFARPESQLARDEIIPHIPYFHERSADRAILFFAGYAHHASTPEAKVVLPGASGERGWWFELRAFNAFRKELEKLTTWRYSGGTDLLLTNGIYDRSAEEAQLDFGSSITANLELMKGDGVFAEAPMFFERLFQFADATGGNDPTWGFSDRQGMRLAASALRELFMAAIPAGVRDDARRARHLVTVDLQR